MGTGLTMARRPLKQVTFRLRQITRQMWFLPGLFSLGALATVAAAHYSALLLPKELPIDVSREAIETILTIVASSMLAVATFALATMVNAFAGAARRTSPRALRLLAQDRSAQMSISTFVGAFLFSIVGIIALSGGFYEASGRLILFGATLLVVGALIRWINKIPSIGQVGETIERIEAATCAAFREVAQTPLLGCVERRSIPPDGVPVFAERMGYVQHMDPADLQELAETHDIRIHVVARADAYATPLQPLAVVEGRAAPEVRNAIRDAFVVARERTFDHDPRHGLIVLNEIADRALSPGVNDPGTAISVIHAVPRIFADWLDHRETSVEPLYDRVSLAPLAVSEMLVDALRPIARDGADKIEVCLNLAKALEVMDHIAPELFRQPVRDAAVTRHRS